jgi:hypothetical protein
MNPERHPRSIIETKIERSSLGTGEARQMRARVSDLVARSIVSRAAARSGRLTATKSTGSGKRSRHIGG